MSLSYVKKWGVWREGMTDRKLNARTARSFRWDTNYQDGVINPLPIKLGAEVSSTST